MDCRKHDNDIVFKHNVNIPKCQPGWYKAMLIALQMATWDHQPGPLLEMLPPLSTMYVLNLPTLIVHG